MKKTLIIICLGLVLTSMLSGCSTHSTTPPLLPSIPQYPSAEKVQIEDTTSTRFKAVERTSFTTKDTPTDVFAFYTNALLKEGWKLGTEAPGATIMFSSIEGCQLTILTISARAGIEGTVVQAELSSQYCD